VRHSTWLGGGDRPAIAHFFADENIGDRVLSPWSYVIGATRALALFERRGSTLVLADWCARLGQDLFYPPNVGGWLGGRSWLTMRSVLGRANYAAALVGGHGVGLPTPLDRRLGPKSRPEPGPPMSSSLHRELLFGSQPDRDCTLGSRTPLPGRLVGPRRRRRAIALILTCPEAQLADPADTAKLFRRFRCLRVVVPGSSLEQLLLIALAPTIPTFSPAPPCRGTRRDGRCWLSWN